MAFAGYPLLRNDEVLGVMALFSRQSLTDFTLKSLGIVADRITDGDDEDSASGRSAVPSLI